MRRFAASHSALAFWLTAVALVCLLLPAGLRVYAAYPGGIEQMLKLGDDRLTTAALITFVSIGPFYRVPAALLLLAAGCAPRGVRRPSPQPRGSAANHVQAAK